MAVSAIPEGLTISLTVILSLGMQRILKKKALVRRLVAAEALGSVTVIATDKTGTLTEGIMRVTETQIKNLDDALDVACYANNLDDPIEFALWDWVSKNNVDPEARNKHILRQKEVPFDSINKYMSVTIDHTTYLKGAPEVVLKFAKITGSEKKKILDQVAEWSKKGLRIIAFAKKSPKHTKYTWIGLIAIEDPVRKGLVKVFEDCFRAGIRVVMITGDYIGTAEAVWRQVTNGHDREIIAVTGEELDKIVTEKLKWLDLLPAKDNLPSDISGGMKKRVGIARALTSNPEILLYDEPTSGLDPVLSNVFNELILRLQKELKVTSIVVTHDMESAFKIANRISFIYEGVVLFCGSPEEIKSTNNEIVQQFINGRTKGPMILDHSEEELKKQKH
ncbi:MAG: HAD-IC family P-type ATPase [Leptospiraceae bacterium]|nr:HAD-IC family P-type ATPase [Leptospiraceae bacterium]